MSGEAFYENRKTNERHFVVGQGGSQLGNLFLKICTGKIIYFFNFEKTVTK